MKTSFMRDIRNATKPRSYSTSIVLCTLKKKKKCYPIKNGQHH